jgi:ribonuclease HII
MTWMIGIDEAGYGPNLGPFVMTVVACRLPHDCAGRNLWDVLTPAVRRGGKDDGRVHVDDSKVVYSTTRGLAGLERGVFAILGTSLGPLPHLAGLIERLSLRPTELGAEAWYTGTSPLPAVAPAEELGPAAERFHATCAETGVGPWRARGVVVCPPRFNALLDAHDSKAAILAHALAELLRCGLELAEGEDEVCFHIDKHGGRNTYTAQLQDALDRGVVVPGEEGMARSCYRVLGLDREVRLTFQPRADAEHFCVALASMTAKYVRELLMGELNRFWQQQVPGLRPTAGYPGDAGRFFEAIRPAAQRLGIAEEAIWRRK